MRGQNPLHVLANYPKDNAAAIAEVFLETMPDYDLNKLDVEGNSGKSLTDQLNLCLWGADVLLFIIGMKGLDSMGPIWSVWL